MKRRFIIVFPFALLLTLLLAGCIRTEVGITLKNDGSGSIGTALLIRADIYEMMSISDDPFEGKDTFSEISNDTEYIGIRENSEYDSAEELKAALFNLTLADNREGNLVEAEGKTASKQNAAIFRSVEIEQENGKLHFVAILNPQSSTDVEGMSGDMDINEVFKLKVSVTMPGKIDFTSAGTTEGKTVIWEIEDLSIKNRIEIVGHTGRSVFPALVITVLLVTTITVLIVLLIIRKRKWQ